MNGLAVPYRDLTIIPIGDQSLVVACDSIGAIGEKPYDALFATYEAVGAAAVRVPILEVLACSAEVICVADTLSVEMEPAGRRIIAAIQKELELAGIAESALNGSTEDNFPTSMTAVGVSVVGIAQTNALKLRSVEKGARAVLAGAPLLGQEVLDYPDKLVSYQTVKSLASDRQVFEIVPVGSKGILYEANLLAVGSGLSFVPNEAAIEWEKSAGPASCVIAAVSTEWVLQGNLVEIGSFA